VSEQRINEFIDERVWREKLSVCLDATDLVKVNKNSAITESLARFVRKSFEIHLNNKTNTSARIRTLDYTTIDLPVPSYNGIVTKLNVRELLACATRKNKRYMK